MIRGVRAIEENNLVKCDRSAPNEVEPGTDFFAVRGPLLLVVASLIVLVTVGPSVHGMPRSLPERIGGSGNS